MFDWFYMWLDPKVMKMEAWVNRRVVQEDSIDIDLDKAKKGIALRIDCFKAPPRDGNYGPYITNLEHAEVLEHMFGPSNMEAFALLDDHGMRRWRYRREGVTHDYDHDAFSSMQEFFEYEYPSSNKYWECVLRTQAVKNDEKSKN